MQYDKLYAMHAGEMYAYGMGFGIDKETVLDAIQDVFLHLIERNNELTIQSNVKLYLLTSLKNRLFSIKRKGITIESLDDTDPYDFSIVVGGVEDVAEEEEEKNRLISQIEGVLKELTGRQREVIYLRYMQGFSYDEIAKLLHVTPKAVRKLNYRALERVKELSKPLC